MQSSYGHRCGETDCGKDKVILMRINFYDTRLEDYRTVLVKEKAVNYKTDDSVNICSSAYVVEMMNSKPSKMDITLTHTFKEAGELLGLPLVEHIIIGENDYFSFMDKGLL